MSYHGTKKMFRDKVECYDCHERVWNLKEHRAKCPRSRKAKSVVNKTTSTSSYASRAVAGAEVKKEHTDFYFLIDVSGSMAGSKLATAKVCAKEMIALNMSPLDRLSIVTFDSGAFFKLKPRVVEEVLRKGELDPILGSIYADGNTALYDAIDLTVSQIFDKAQRTVIIVLTDGADNSSKTTYAQVLEKLKQYPNISLHIVHIDGSGRQIPAYIELCAATNNGEYTLVAVEETIIKVTIEKIVKRYYTIV